MQYVGAGGIANDTTIDSGGIGYVHTGGALHDVTFAGAGGTLVLDEAAAFSGEISGWEDGDRIALGDIDFGESTTLAYVANAGNTGGTLTVSDGSHVASLNCSASTRRRILRCRPTATAARSSATPGWRRRTCSRPRFMREFDRCDRTTGAEGAG